MFRSCSLLLLVLGSFSAVHSLKCYVCEGCDTVSDADSKTCGETSTSTSTTTLTPSTVSSTSSPGSSTESSSSSSTTPTSSSSSTQSSTASSTQSSTTLSTQSSSISSTQSTTPTPQLNEFIATKATTYDTKCAKAILEEIEGSNVTVVRFCFPPEDETLLNYLNVIRTIEVCDTDNCNLGTFTQSTPLMIGMTMLLLFKMLM